MQHIVKGSLAAVTAMLMLATAATAAVGPEGKCEAGKNQESGKYAFCLHKAEAKLLKTRGACSVATETDCYRDEDCPMGESCIKDTTKYDEAVTKCENKYSAKWSTLELKASEASATCPDGLLQTEVKQVIDECVSNVAAGLAGEGLGDCAGDLATCSGDLGTCNGSLGTCTTSLSSCSGNLSTCNGHLSTCTTDLGSAQAALTTCNGNLSTCSGDLGTCNGSLATCTTDLGTCNGDLGTCETDLAAAVECGNGGVDAGEDCDQSDLDGESCASQSFAGGTLGCGAACAFDTSGCYATRFADNTDGTITDNETGLEWEKKVKLNSTTDLANLQDADNGYRWSGTCSVLTSKRCQPNAAASAACIAGVEGNPDGCAECTGGDGVCNVGSPGVTIWQWLVDLNTASFGGHSDWRMAKRTELETILDIDYSTWTPPVVDVAFHGASCGVACTDVTDPACACTRSNFYWSASSYAPGPLSAWFVDFDDGFVNASGKSSGTLSVRAVRGGS